MAGFISIYLIGIIIYQIVHQNLALFTLFPKLSQLKLRYFALTIEFNTLFYKFSSIKNVNVPMKLV